MPRAPQYEAGDAVGRFKLLSPLGEGAYAEVWKATDDSDLGLQKLVALKILKDLGDDGDHAEALLKEARLCSNLRHPNIVDVYEVGRADGAIHVAMEFVDGGSLADMVRRVHHLGLTVPPTVLLEIGVGICSALHRAHNYVLDDGTPQKIIHRDLKPANILLSRSGIPKVADFGLAKAEGDATATATGKVRGTPLYMAPEIWRGTREFHPYSDLFSVGCVLWQLATLEAPFKAPSLPEIFTQIAYGDPDLEAAALAPYDQRLVPVIRGLLERVPEERTQTARELSIELQELRRTYPGVGGVEDFLELLRRADLSGEERAVQPSSDLGVSQTGEAWVRVREAAQGTLPDRRPTPSMLPPDFRSGGALETEVLRRRADVLSSTKEFEPDAAVEGGVRRSLVLAVGLGTAVAVFAAGLVLVGRVGAPENGEAEVAASAIPAHSADVSGLDVPRPDSSAPTAPADAARESNGALPEEAEAGTQGNDGAVGAGAESKAESGPTASGEVGSREKVPAAVSPAPKAAAPPKQAVEAGQDEVTSAAGSPVQEPVPIVESCLVLTSAPAGGRVWLDGVAQSRRAGLSPRRGELRSAGRITVQMGTDVLPSAETKVQLIAGSATHVHCQLSGATDCSVEAALFEICQ